MLDSAVRLRLRTRQFTNRRKPTGTRYSAAFRVEAVSVARIARELGLRTQALSLWLRRERLPKLRAVRVERDLHSATPVASTTPEIRPVVVTPNGVRIEGLDLDGLVRVMRSLA